MVFVVLEILQELFIRLFDQLAEKVGLLLLLFVLVVLQLIQDHSNHLKSACGNLAVALLQSFLEQLVLNGLLNLGVLDSLDFLFLVLVILDSKQLYVRIA